MFNNLLKRLLTLGHLQGSNVLEIKQAIGNGKKILTAKPTAKQWLQYLEIVCSS